MTANEKHSTVERTYSDTVAKYMYNPLTRVSTRMLVRTFIVASNYNIFDLIWTNTRKAENSANITL